MKTENFIKALLLFFFLLFLCLMFLTSCSANYYLKKSIEYKNRAIVKGAKVSLDTTFKDIPFSIAIPNLDTSKELVLPVDTSMIRRLLSSRDSAVSELVKLAYLQRAGKAVFTEETYHRIDVLNGKLERIRGLFGAGMLRDTTISFHPDSITVIDLVISGGHLLSTHISRKEVVLTEHKKVPILVEEKTKTGFSLFQLIACVIVALFVAYAVNSIYRGRKNSNNG